MVSRSTLLPYGTTYVLKSHSMSGLRPSQDVRPVTEFRAKASAFLDQLHQTRRPVMLTQHGRCAAVLLDVAAYEDLLDELSQLRDANGGQS
jgi:antitoxin YefM